MIEIGDTVTLNTAPPLSINNIVGTDGYPVRATVLRIPTDTGGHWEFDIQRGSIIAIPASIVIVHSYDKPLAPQVAVE